MKAQVIIDSDTGKVLCTAYAPGSVHDFRLFRESETHIAESTVLYADSGYTGIHGLHPYSILPERKPRGARHSPEAKRHNRLLSAVRVGVENVIGFLKRFRILKGVYRNRRKRLGLRFNLIAGICNHEIH